MHVTGVSTGFLEWRIPINLLKSDPTTNAVPTILDAVPVIGVQLEWHATNLDWTARVTEKDL